MPLIALEWVYYDDHLIPSDDLVEHMLAKTCWCKPIENECGVFLHNSLDRREDVEDGKRLIQ